MNYRILGPDEVIQNGDEFYGYAGWVRCTCSIGQLSGVHPFSIRRPIPSPDSLIRELAEALAACAWMIKDKSPSDYSKANAVLAKYKESIK